MVIPSHSKHKKMSVSFITAVAEKFLTKNSDLTPSKHHLFTQLITSYFLPYETIQRDETSVISNAI
jgi:hypothetical protein